MQDRIQALVQHQIHLKACTLCEDMIGPAVTCETILSKVLLVGQAPGDKEPLLARPFAWTAGKTLFKWFNTIGLDEAAFRQRVYMAAVCRCFPGKNPKGGDRVPNKGEIETCSAWLNSEFEMLQPQLLLPVGKLAISQFLPVKKLTDVIGKQHRIDFNGHEIDIIPLPHPSGASTWHRMEPGKTLLQEALDLIELHPAWQKVLDN